MRGIVALVVLGWSVPFAAAQADAPKKGTRTSAVRAALVAQGLPDLGGKWPTRW